MKLMKTSNPCKIPYWDVHSKSYGMAGRGMSSWELFAFITDLIPGRHQEGGESPEEWPETGIPGAPAPGAAGFEGKRNGGPGG